MIFEYTWLHDKYYLGTTVQSDQLQVLNLSIGDLWLFVYNKVQEPITYFDEHKCNRKGLALGCIAVNDANYKKQCQQVWLR